LSFNLDGRPCEYIGACLNKEGFCVRAGLHCSPLAHKTIGTLDIGTVRISLSYFNTEREIKKLIRALKNIN
ncbi:MAG: aminotransferase class V-fold PLP-dependent enzyme, partial [Clostridia bacterium]|nr:aminotransferase class V-fold PLP-dependent enzyme [Clostridia bacterium]